MTNATIIERTISPGAKNVARLFAINSAFPEHKDGYAVIEGLCSLEWFVSYFRENPVNFQVDPDELMDLIDTINYQIKTTASDITKIKTQLRNNSKAIWFHADVGQNRNISTLVGPGTLYYREPFRILNNHNPEDNRYEDIEHSLEEKGFYIQKMAEDDILFTVKDYSLVLHKSPPFDSGRFIVVCDQD